MNRARQRLFFAAIVQTQFALASRSASPIAAPRDRQDRVNCRHSSVTVIDRTITDPPASKLHCQEADTAAEGFPPSQLAGWSD